ncbi:SDR family NAD(P)-dependent oxidoreductase [Agromyces sp. Soil535]|uniref:SDR family NAD(P)-dependent oxidoreductase n=1 Tax=Agromyces sp. Soil535 TaxID=1736390 RepID=UPI0006F864D2|nr:SDR family NAD(P)-dependent oxidoreductase [Agromyces sp. Soil535]KRE21514.1 short-chain dehydrogenase [Agromyces sp. Soil535]
MTITLITGGNKGLGFETARALLGAGHTVYLGARDPGRGEAAAAALGARHLTLDVTDDTSVAAAAALIEEREGVLDVLVNNAGIAGSLSPPRDTRADDVLRVYETNVFGIVRMMHAFIPLLERSTAPVVVNVGSGMGSLAVTTDPERLESTLVGIGYPSSKTAVNMITSQYAKGLPRFRVNVVDPGYTATDLNGHRGIQSVAEGAAIIVGMATIGADGPTGSFVAASGPVAW